MNKIKPCPFCGNDGICNMTGEFKHLYVNEDSDSSGATPQFYYWVECGGCDAQGSVRETEEEAIKYWNNAHDETI
jgi:hypothetical protein